MACITGHCATSRDHKTITVAIMRRARQLDGDAPQPTIAI
jgi:hypothetical protein